ncbi:hypothetical protein [Cohnella hashimotonis]|uniref:Uncharacterized protein n=1 Tax=Cohnella hashimotonis TaxID=2826895 RepID=A0ABT6TBC5_9BACL|nr:hypothetical protein [Cohnella hashimotonis]MDI4644069.1 hypothetical protein [Cohnella hashimotonis]
MQSLTILKWVIVCDTDTFGRVQDTGRSFRLLAESNGTDVYPCQAMLP